jgi:hypothetical protein
MGAFEEYLGALNDRAKMEHDAYVQDYVQKQQVAQNVMNTIGQIGTAIQQDRQARGEYEQAVNQTGAFKPEDMILNNFVTPHEKQVNALTDHINQQNMQNSLTIQNLMKAKASGILTAEQQKNLDDAQAKQIDYARQLNDAGQQIEQYKQTPEYQDAVYNAKRQMFYKQYPVYSQKYYEAIQGAKDLLAKRQWQQHLQQLDDEERIRHKYDQPKTPAEHTGMVDWNSKMSDVQNNMDYTDAQRNAATKLTRQYSAKYKNVTDKATLIQAEQEYNDALMQITGQQDVPTVPQQQGNGKTFTPNGDINNSLIQKYSR